MRRPFEYAGDGSKWRLPDAGAIDQPPAMPPDVAAVFERFPPEGRARLLSVRETIFGLAERLKVGPLTETLKWGQPAYLTEATGAGSTVRLAWAAKEPEVAQVLFVCTTRLVDEFRAQFDGELVFAGNRAIHLPLVGGHAKDALERCLARALTYKKKPLSNGLARR